MKPAARNKILAGACDVALVVGADTTPKGFLAPAGENQDLHELAVGALAQVVDI